MTIERATPEPRTLSPEALLDLTTDEVISQPGDSQRLLTLAESLQERLNELADRKLRFLFLVAGGCVLWSVIFMSFVGTHPEMPSNGLFARFLASSLILVPVIISAYVQNRRIRGGTARLRRSLREVVSLLRESEQTLAVQEGWSAMQRAEFRIRLSQFDIDPAA